MKNIEILEQPFYHVVQLALLFPEKRLKDNDVQRTINHRILVCVWVKKLYAHSKTSFLTIMVLSYYFKDAGGLSGRQTSYPKIHSKKFLISKEYFWVCFVVNSSV